MEHMDDPYRRAAMPLVRVMLNGTPTIVPQEVVGPRAAARALGIRDAAVYREKGGRPVGPPLDGVGHVFHAGDRYVAVHRDAGIRVA